MGYIDRIQPNTVNSPELLSRYICQTLGTQWTLKDELALKKKVRLFIEANPKANFQTFVKTTQWARAKKKRPAHLFYIPDFAKYAWADGMLSELDPDSTDETLELKIREALETENDPEWRRRLIGSEGEEREKVYLAWTSRG